MRLLKKKWGCKCILVTFPCILLKRQYYIVWFLVQFGKTCTRKFLKHAEIALVYRTRAILNAFQKLTRACFS